MEEDRLPYAEELKHILHVEVRPPIGRPRVKWILITNERARPLVHRLGPRILRLSREVMRSLVPQSGDQCIVVSRGSVPEVIHVVELRINGHTVSDHNRIK